MANNGWYKLEAERRAKNSGGQANRGNTPNRPSGQGQNTARGNNSSGGSMARRAYNENGRQNPAPQQVNRRPAPPPEPKAPYQQGRAIAPMPKDEEKHSQTVGPRGPVVLQDAVLHETLETFVNSNKIQRVVHTKGFGARGHFQVTNSMQEYTKASLFQTQGQQVPVAVRFSLAVSNPGTPDTSRNVRGFSTKFYGEDGVYDLLCNHIPVFLVRDAMRFPDSIKSFLPSQKNNLSDPNIFWGFIANAPEATHFLTWLYSDVGTIKSLRKTRAYSVNTYVWRNAQGVRRYVKYHWIPLAGEEYIDAKEAAALAGSNPDVAGQDLYDTISAGTPVEYELRVQMMDPADEGILPFDPLDDTKVWSEVQYPLLPVGKLVLNRNPDDFDAQVENLAFSPANLPDGVEFSDDKMLQGRSTVYWDAQRRRLGPDFRSIPVNAQKNWKPADLASSGIGKYVEGNMVRTDLPVTDNFTQAGERYMSLSPEQQEHLVDNMAASLSPAKRDIQNTVLGYLSQASQELGQRVLKRMNEYNQGGQVM